jgi:pSer/pThr/pTyr-binding forkhead associated (FHA) protein
VRRIVPVSSVDPDGVSPAELQERVRADRRGEPYLLFRDGAGGQQILALSDQAAQLTIGRAPGCDVCLAWDEGISRAHARLERLGKDAWMLVDDGLSRNGSIVNGQRLRHRRRLIDGDVLRFGATSVLYRAPSFEAGRTLTLAASSAEIELSPAQRRVLVALCRPYRDGGDVATPASNREIADELVLSIEAVKTQLRALFEKFDVEPLARDMKRTRLVQRAFETGAISRRDLDE